MTDDYTVRQQRVVYGWISTVLTVLGCCGFFWGQQPGGQMTRTVGALADIICPPFPGHPTKPASVAGGAHALDIAAIRRASDGMFGTTRCRPTRRRQVTR